ncbi:rhomboid family intramembrane serine protease [Aureimonas sp. SA4125]|uniref:rhomboid family intramembrane serine protease n=1 Tax=Aureimonas sp. SA4125 TaxID=2826993 RepID=UPI001CC44C4F|nr:rhomboid family intramembrane serine protease [Aureimonas sp. SA4125]BDA84923.1 rhomboid family intramembrane serine protease [Aureimonas sp. SA4125]
MSNDDFPPVRVNPPAFNVPGVVLAAILAFTLVQALRSFVLTPDSDDWLITEFSFVAACYSENCAEFFGRDPGAQFWSPLSYAFLHGDWMHLGLNVIWMLAFGTPVARRLGNARVIAFSAVGAMIGALAFYVSSPDLMVPVIGASGIVSALMGGACRFALGSVGRPLPAGADLPLLSIRQALSDRTVIFFIVIFFATNLLTASGLGGFLDGGASVAWQAHLGGFVFGFLGLALFEPHRRQPLAPREAMEEDDLRSAAD